MPRLFQLALIAITTLGVGCALPPTTGVVRLYDGLLKAPNAAQAEAFCRIDGAPIRFLDQPRGDDLPKDGVLFRCD